MTNQLHPDGAHGERPSDRGLRVGDGSTSATAQRRTNAAPREPARQVRTVLEAQGNAATLLDHSRITAPQSRGAAGAQMQGVGFAAVHDAYTKYVLQTGNEALGLSRVEATADSQAIQAQIVQNDPARVVGIETFYGLRKRLVAEPEPAVLPGELVRNSNRGKRFSRI